MLFYPSLQDGKPNTTLDELAIKSGNEIKRILVDGAKAKGGSRSYVNYANGGESLEEMYGPEEWRLQKLRRLKRAYDPENKFQFYAPIGPEEEKDGRKGHDEL